MHIYVRETCTCAYFTHLGAAKVCKGWYLQNLTFFPINSAPHCGDLASTFRLFQTAF